MEQAVQTGSLDNLNARKPSPGKGTVGMQLNGRPTPPGTKSASGTARLVPPGAPPVLAGLPVSWGGGVFIKKPSPRSEQHALPQSRPRRGPPCCVSVSGFRSRSCFP